MDRLPAVVIDNGTGYTKLGFAGNTCPQFIIPTVVSYKQGFSIDSGNKRGIADLEYSIGHQALAMSKAYTTAHPIKHAQVDNWELMERFHQACIYHYLRCEPEDHYFLLTEPPVNTPENREYTAEIFFESFGVKGLYIAVQAVLSLVAGWSKDSGVNILTGTVIDSGDGVTHVIPVVDGYVIGSSIKSIPIAGRDISRFVQHLLRERETNIPPGDALDVARHVKENFSYVCPNPIKEFSKYEYSHNNQNIIKVDMIEQVTKKPYSIDVGFERFMGPEVFFKPEMVNSEYATPLANIVDQVIQSCPIDTRKALYKNIVLSGGSTMFKDLGKRLKRDIKNIADARVKGPDSVLQNKSLCSSDNFSRSIDVNVIGHKRQKYAVWFGGSILADTSEFYACCHTREQYMEVGPSIARYNKIFTSLL